MKGRKMFLRSILAILLFLSELSAISEIGLIDARRLEEFSDSALDARSEFTSGSMEIFQGMNVWYAWINSSGTNVIFLTYYSDVYNSPIITFLGQHYRTAGNKEVFIGNTLLLMEAYNDTNGNGIPDADFGTGNREIEYFFLVNSSAAFSSTPVKKTTVGNVPHYSWGIEYGWVDGFLLYPEDRTINNVSTNVAARVNMTSLALKYEYYILGNVTYLKTGFEAGKIADFEPLVQNVSLNGLGLSLVYGTDIFASENYTILVGDKAYDSRSAQASATSATRSQIVVESSKIYEFIFEENYTLHRNMTNESFASESSASPTESVPPNSVSYLSWRLGFFSENVFPRINASLPRIDLGYANSSLVYRVCYPTWEGWEIEHDPTYLAYLGVAQTNTPPPNSPSPTATSKNTPTISPTISPSSPPDLGQNRLRVETIATVAIALGGLIALAIAIIELRKTR